MKDKKIDSDDCGKFKNLTFKDFNSSDLEKLVSDRKMIETMISETDKADFMADLMLLEQKAVEVAEYEKNGENYIDFANIDKERLCTINESYGIKNISFFESGHVYKIENGILEKFCNVYQYLDDMKREDEALMREIVDTLMDEGCTKEEAMKKAPKIFDLTKLRMAQQEQYKKEHKE